MINMMVGRVIYEEPKSHSMVAPDAPVVLKVSNLNAGRLVRDINFELRKGEILGFAGLMGAGRTETMRALYGADPSTGIIEIDGTPVLIREPLDAVRRGIGSSADRKRWSCHSPPRIGQP